LADLFYLDFDFGREAVEANRISRRVVVIGSTERNLGSLHLDFEFGREAFI
jgi:hypothetical protein